MPDKIYSTVQAQLNSIETANGTVTSVTGTAPIAVATGTSTPVISIAAATGSVPGSMSAADKTKLDAIEASATANPSSYGGMYVADESAATVALTVAGTYYPVVASVQTGTVKGAGFVTFNAATLVIGVSGAGVYLVNLSFSGILSAADILDIAIHKGGAIQQNLRSDQTVTVTTNYASSAITGLLTLAANDIIDVRAACDAGSHTLSMHHMNLTLLRVA